MSQGTLYPHLLSPLHLGHVTLRNRLVFGAHTANMSEGGLPGARHLGYYRERARGGAGMIVAIACLLMTCFSKPSRATVCWSNELILPASLTPLTR